MVDATRTEPAPPTPARATADDPDIEYVAGVSYPRVAVLVLVVAAIAGILGWQLAGGGDGEGDPSAVDEGFVIDMRTHHQQAVEMALVELANGEEPDVQSYAREILIRQNVELGLMAAELEDWGIPTDRRPDTAMAWMDAPLPWQEMPGLATDEQMAAFRAASGREADTLFLELMAAHHHGGVHMASYAAEEAATDDVRVLARSMAAIQAVEIGELAGTARRQGLDADIEPYVDDE